jgi:lysine 2,3-aminomutase
MTDIGKVTLYEGVIRKKDKNKYLLQTGYSLVNRLKWNPGWVLPPNAEIDDQGYLRIWYIDAF